VNRQYDQLKSIIDEQRVIAQDTIKNLESIQEYTPPRKDFTKETLDSMKSFVKEVEEEIKKQNGMSEKRQFFQVLRERNKLEALTTKTTEFANAIASHKCYLEENSRPQIEVRSEVDKFRGFLHDVVSFEPDYILQ
jgi:hypothetical protein